jgi:hypothetical protein
MNRTAIRLLVALALTAAVNAQPAAAQSEASAARVSQDD